MRRVILAAALLAALPAAAQAADYTVNTTEDRGGPGCASDRDSCSLRQALGRADSGDTVRLPAGSYGLAAPLVITRGGVTLEGEAARETTIDGGAATRLFDVQAPGALTVDDVTLRRGDARSQGGAAFVAEGASLTLVDSAVLLSNAGSAGLAGAGGAVYNEGTLVLLRSLLAANRAVPSTVALGEGGAVLNAGTFVATSSTISGNAAGGSALAGRGGAVSTAAGARTTLVHVTLAGNSAGGGGSGGSLSTATGGSTTLRASIVTGGVARPLVDNCEGGVVSRGANVAGGNSCGLSGPGDRSNADPLLDGLRDNGGSTDTHMPRPGSPAIDLVPGDACAASDQRGYVRPAGAGCDAGAAERDGQPAPRRNELPPPVLGATFNLQRVEGKVYIRRPGSRALVRLTTSEQVPIETIVYASEGLASVTGQTSTAGALSTGHFFQGSFSLGQDRADDDDASAVPVDVQLRGAGPDDCTPSRRRLHPGAGRKLDFAHLPFPEMREIKVGLLPLEHPPSQCAAAARLAERGKSALGGRRLESGASAEGALKETDRRASFSGGISASPPPSRCPRRVARGNPSRRIGFRASGARPGGSCQTPSAPWRA